MCRKKRCFKLSLMEDICIMKNEASLTAIVDHKKLYHIGLVGLMNEYIEKMNELLELTLLSWRENSLIYLLSITKYRCKLIE